MGAAGRLKKVADRQAVVPVIGGQLAAGSVVDNRYRIDAELGRGGMAVVYRATHLKLGKRVALKVMSPSLAADAAFRQFFEREARAASEIEHEHVVPVTDFGEDRSGLYIVMRYIEGPNLKQLLQRRGPLDPDQAVQIAEDVASALDAAHGLGFLHRDVKPANILSEESTGRIYLADFGLARAVVDDDRTRTKSQLLGTDWYMAPERRRGEDTKLGDIYSLGCVLWEMLAGLASPPPGHSAQPSDGQVPEGLCRVTERAVSQRPLDRFESAGDLARAARAAITPSPSDSVRGRLEPGDGSTTGPLVRPQPFHEALSDGLSSQVIALCDDTLGTLAREVAHDQIERIRRTLLEPLSLAIAGSPGSGKSTLVNALLGCRIAGTGFAETTPIVTWFRYDTQPRVEVVLRGGTRVAAPLTSAGELPVTLSASAEDVSGCEVWLPAEILRALTIVDTPGLTGSGDSDDALSVIGAAEETAAIQRADALLFTMAGDVLAADRDALEAFKRRFSAAGRASAINAIGVLTKADTVAAEARSWGAAVGRADRLHNALGSLVSAVVPVAGRLAETATTDGLTEPLLGELSRLAALPTDRRLAMLESDSAFRGNPAVEDAPVRARLLSLLGIYGLGRALELADANTLSIVAVNEDLRDRSGIDGLRQRIDGLQLRADALKADAALAELESLAWKHHRELGPLRDRIEEVRLGGQDMHLLDVMRDFDRCASGEIELGDGMLEELEQLLTGRTAAERLGLSRDSAPGEQRAEARRRVRAWATYRAGGRASFQAEQVAGHVVHSYQLLAELG